MASGSVCRPDLPPTYRNTYREQPLPMQRAPASSSEALSLEQRQFAAEQHNLIYAYLNEKGLYHEEYYDIAAFGYLQAVKRYLTQPALRQYAFSTIAWRAMSSALHNDTKKKRRQIKTVSLDDMVPGCEDLTWGEVITEKNLEYVPYAEVS